MLIEFKFKNYLSYKDESILNMTTVKSFKELKKTNVISKASKNMDLLKSASIFGSNGGGKTNFIGAFNFMKSIFHNSYSDSLLTEHERHPKDYYFKLSTETENKPSEFEVSFIYNDIIYRYGFEINGYEIVSEWLYKKKETETLLFSRKNGRIEEINKKSFSDAGKYIDNVNSNVLFSSHLAQNNSKDILPVFEFFFTTNVINGLSDKYHSGVTKKLYNEIPEFRKWLSYALKFLDITSIQVDERGRILAYHNKYNEHGLLIDSVAFNVEYEESVGTNKIIHLLGAVYDTLASGNVLFIDELDSNLHPNLTKKLLELFHEHNKLNAQLIFTLHDANILSNKILRRDQIWFVDRNKFGTSELYSMADFDSSVVRNTSDFRKKYLDNSFGASETIDVTDKLVELLYAK